MLETVHFNCKYFVIYVLRNVRCFSFCNSAFFNKRSLSFICSLFFQILGKKPELRDGDDDEDTTADITNRKMAKLYMVSLHVRELRCFYWTGCSPGRPVLVRGEGRNSQLMMFSSLPSKSNL